MDTRRSTQRRRGRGARALLFAVLALTALGWVVLAGPLGQVRAQRLAGCTFFADVYAWFQDGRVVRVSPGDGIYYQPCIRPDGSELLFTGAAEGPPRIWVVDLETFELRALTEPDSAAIHAVYSWDGKRIAFSSDRDSGSRAVSVDRLAIGGQPNTRARFHLYSMDADGSNIQRLTAGESADWRPTFSPAGDAVVYSAEIGDSQALFELAVPEPGEPRGQPQRIAGTEGMRRPWFAADGRSLFFHSTGAGRHRVHRIAREGGTAMPFAGDIFERTHGSFVDPRTGSLLVHARQEGEWGIWELPLEEGGAAAGPRPLQPPGFSAAYHATRAGNGTLAFDLPRDTTTWREVLRRLGWGP